jgi:hypothetical protein
MWRNLIGLSVGPIALTALGFFSLPGEWGVGVAAILLIASVIYIPLFALGTIVFGSSLMVILLVANGIPLGYQLWICLGNSCRHMIHIAYGSMYLAATFCALLYWAIAARKR